MNMIMQLFGMLVKGVVVLAINVSLFLVIPVSHSLFGMFDEKKEEEVDQKRIVAEFVRPKEEKPKEPPKTRLRSVDASQSQPLQNPMKFKFTPDLAMGGAGDGVGIANEEMSAEVFESGEVDQQATPVYQPYPDFPDRAKQLGVEGEVTVTFVVGVDGMVRSIEEVNAPHPSLSSEVRKTVSSWKFNPAMNKGVPVESRMRIILDFGLES